MLQFRVLSCFCAFLCLFRAFRLALFVVCNHFVPFGFDNSCSGFVRPSASCPLAYFRAFWLSFVPFWLQFRASASCFGLLSASAFCLGFVPQLALAYFRPGSTWALRISCLKLVFRISLLLQPFRPVGVVLLKNRTDDYSYLLRSVLFWLLAIIAVYIIY